MCYNRFMIHSKKHPKKRSRNHKLLKWKLLSGALILLVLLGYFYIQSARHERHMQAQRLSMEEALFVRTVDGDTIKVKIDGTVYTVRLIGIDCPESVHPDSSKNTEAGRRASAYTSSLLKEGQLLYLQKDVSETDRYGRLLRYVWLSLPDDPDSEAEQRSLLLNAKILLSGNAKASPYPPDTSRKELFSRLEHEVSH